jgi:hypothetical protein
MFADYIKACELICRRIGWINWERIRSILEGTIKSFPTPTEQKFIEALIHYLIHKEKEAIELMLSRSGARAQLV